MDITIRPVRTEDAEAINELRRMPGVFENIMGIPSERLQRNIDGINSLGPNDHNFVAVYRTPSGEEKVISTGEDTGVGEGGTAEGDADGVGGAAEVNTGGDDGVEGFLTVITQIVLFMVFGLPEPFFI